MLIPSSSLPTASLLLQVAQALLRRLDHFVDLSLPNVSPRTVPNPQTSRRFAAGKLRDSGGEWKVHVVSKQEEGFMWLIGP